MTRVGDPRQSFNVGQNWIFNRLHCYLIEFGHQYEYIFQATQFESNMETLPYELKWNFYKI